MCGAVIYYTIAILYGSLTENEFRMMQTSSTFVMCSSTFSLAVAFFLHKNK